jgi:hypothetical protein
MIDTEEFKLTVAVAAFVMNPLNDHALYQILGSKLPVKKGISEDVVAALKNVQGQSEQPVPAWHLLHEWLRQLHHTASKTSTDKKRQKAVQNFMDWQKRCEAHGVGCWSNPEPQRSFAVRWASSCMSCNLHTGCTTN